MSTNTIKLSSAEGDKYISPQQTLTYKGIELFGYGYLDWGTVANQSLVTLVDMIDALQDSGLSEIKFDLTEYEEEQKRLRADEFATWKTGFKTVITSMMNEYTTTVNQSISDFKVAQKLIDDAINKEIDENYIELKDDVKALSLNLDERILGIVQNQIMSISDQISSFSTSLDKATNALKESTIKFDAAIIDVKKSIDNFKSEFEAIFETFKSDTSKALNDNKDYIIEYINSRLNITNTTTSGLDTRLTALELSVGALDDATITSIIINKVNASLSAAIEAYLDSYEDRLDTLTNSINNISNNLTTLVEGIVNTKLNDITNDISTLNNSVANMTQKINTINSSISPLVDFKNGLIAEYGSVEELIETLTKLHLVSYNNIPLIGGIITELKGILKNSLLSNVKQTNKNIENVLGFINSTILNFVDGLGNTKFDELSLIKRASAKTNLINNSTSEILGNINSYSNSELKFTASLLDLENLSLHFAFRLPQSLLTLWDTYAIDIVNLTSDETIESVFQVVDSPFTIDGIKTIGTSAISDVVPGNINYFNYSLLMGTTGLISAKFETLNDTDSIKIFIKKNNSIVANISFKVNEISEILTIDTNYKNVLAPKYFNIDTNLTPYKIVDQVISYSNNNNNNIIIPFCEIQNTLTSKEFVLKIKLPVDGTMVSIDFNDGTTSYSKPFFNHLKFPLTEAEFNTRNLGNTNNYYNDICSTGVIRFPINSNSTSINGTISYKINGVTKTYPITTSSNGAISNIVNATIAAGSYTEINISTLFNSNTDSKLIMVETRAQETNTSSDLFGKFIKADNLCSIVWMDSSIIRVYNEYSTSLVFQILLKN